MLLAKARTASALLLAGVVLGLGAAPAQAQVTLRYKFKEGDKLNYDMAQKMEMKMNVAGNDITMNMNQDIDMAWRVLKVEPSGKAQIEQKIGRIRMTMDGLPGVGKIEYDSKDGKEPEGPIGKILGPILNALAGAEFTVTMDPRGEISDVKLPDKLAEAMKNLPAGGQGLGDMFSPEGLKRLVNQGGLVLPQEPVSKGKAWDQKVEMKMPFGMMKVVNQMTYEGTEDKGGKTLQRIGVTPKVTIEPDPNAPINIKTKATDAKGTAYFNNTAGRLVEMQMVQNMQMDIGAGGQDITQNIRTTTTLKLKNQGE
jgi:hypothetical protein